MNFLLDNNLPPALARALHALTIDNYCKAHSVLPLREKFSANTPDIVWIEALAREKNWAVITHDRFNKAMEPEVLRQAGLIVFLLGKTWKNHSFWDKAYQLVRWWPLIIEQAERLDGAATFEVPYRVSGKGKFKQIKL